MTEALEHEDDFEEYELEDGPDEEQSDDPRVEAINAEIETFERQSGVELSDEEWDHIGRHIELFGVTPEQAYGRTDSGRFETNFEEAVDRIERDQARTLLDEERERLWENATDQAEHEKPLLDLDDSNDLVDYIDRSMGGTPEREQSSATVVDDDGSERPGFDLDNPNQRAEVIDRLMEGEDVAAYDNSSFTTIEGDE